MADCSSGVQGVLEIIDAGDIEFKSLKEKSWGSKFSADHIGVEPEIGVVEFNRKTSSSLCDDDCDCFIQQLLAASNLTCKTQMVICKCLFGCWCEMQSKCAR